jgi:hypothetical protein
MSDQAHSGSAPGSGAALVIRVWRDTPDTAGFKARITRRPDLSADAETTTVVTSSDAVYSEVRAWLELFLDRSSDEGSV